MRMGMEIKIDVTKLDKARFYQGKKGTYATLTAFVDTEKVSEYGDNGTVTQAIDKGERQSGVKLPILGNTKIFYTDAGGQGHQQNQKAAPDNNHNITYDADDVPF